MRKNIGYFDHECDLPHTVDNCMQELSPYLPKYRRWFFTLRKFFILDEQSLKAKRFFRSYASVRAEKRRHILGPYSKIIHPFSRCVIYKERTVCILWMISLFLDPIRISFFMSCDSYHYLFKIQWTLDALFILNVILSCFTGYYVPYTKEILLSPKQIIKHRIFSFFIPETIACLPLKEVAVAITGINQRKSRIASLSIIRCFRFMRLLEMVRHLTEILEDLKVPESLSTLGIVFLMAFYVIHWLGCILYFISICYYTWDGLPLNSWISEHKKGIDSDTLHSLQCAGFSESFLNLYVLAFIRATCHFFGASEGYRPVILSLEKLTCSFVVIVGFTYCMYAMAKVLELFGSVNISESKYEELIHQVAEYVRSKNISDTLKKRLITYYEYKFQKKFFKEEEILSTFSEHLRCEVSLYTCKNVLDRVPLFYGMSRASLGSIVGFMQREIYLPNDVVLKFGDPLLKMFWVSHGTLAVYYGPEGVEILHFEDGDHFADLAITKKGGTAYLSVVALEITEIFTLRRKDVKHCTIFLKEMSEKVVRVSRDKSRLYKMLSEMMKNEESRNRVLADLRKGRILEKERWRKRRKHLAMRR